MTVILCTVFSYAPSDAYSLVCFLDRHTTIDPEVYVYYAYKMHSPICSDSKFKTKVAHWLLYYFGYGLRRDWKSSYS
jgi:hypothetical protein